jgi:hypothetical protein
MSTTPAFERTTIRDGVFRSNRQLLEEIRDVLAPSYLDASALLDREVAHCETLYLATDEDRRLSAFFMVAWESITVGGVNLPSVYMGLSAAREDLKSTGHVRDLYAMFVSDAATWQRITGRTLVLWYTTATPSAYLAASAMFDNVEPRPDGTYSERAARIAAAITSAAYPGVESNGHPFVLSAAAPNTRYSERERIRIDGLCQKKGFTLFTILGIDESKGDRLLSICSVPDAAV